MKDYNGFSADERQKGWNVQKALKAKNEIDWDKPCDMCGQTSSDGCLIMPHQENYLDPHDFYPMCVECHMRLHARFSRPNDWLNYLYLIHEGHKPKPWATVYAYIKSNQKLPVAKSKPFIQEHETKWYHTLKLVPVNLKEEFLKDEKYSKPTANKQYPMDRQQVLNF